MKYIFWVFFLSAIFSGLTINFNHILYAQDSSFNNAINKINEERYSQSQYINFSYKSYPFLILSGTDFIEISNNDTLSLHHFSIGVWVNTNQSTLLEPAHIVNKGGFNTDTKGKNMNYGLWFSIGGTISGGFEPDLE